MIQTHSHDPDVAAAARKATAIVRDVLRDLPPATMFDYGGHMLHLDEYGICVRCSAPIAEAQQASQALLQKADATADDTVAAHIRLAGDLLRLEAEAAQIRAELHSGHSSEPIINELLGFIYHRGLHDTYNHSHGQDHRND